MKKRIAALLIAAAVGCSALPQQGTMIFAGEVTENVVSGDGEELPDTSLGKADNDPEISVAEDRENAGMTLSETPGGQTGIVGDGLFEDGVILENGTAEVDAESSLPASDEAAGRYIDNLGELLLEDEASGSTQAEGDGITEPDAEQETEPSTEEWLLEEEDQGDEDTLEMGQEAGGNREMPSVLSLGENTLTFDSSGSGTDGVVKIEYRFTAPVSGGFRFTLTPLAETDKRYYDGRVTDEATGDRLLVFGNSFAGLSAGSGAMEMGRTYSVSVTLYSANGSSQATLKIEQVPLPENVQMKLTNTSILQMIGDMDVSDVTLYYTVAGKSCTFRGRGSDPKDTYGYTLTDFGIEDEGGKVYLSGNGFNPGVYYCYVVFAGKKYREKFTVEPASDETTQEIKPGETVKVEADKETYYRFAPQETGFYRVRTNHGNLDVWSLQNVEGDNIVNRRLGSDMDVNSGTVELYLNLQKGKTYHIAVHNGNKSEETLQVRRMKKAVAMDTICKETALPDPKELGLRKEFDRIVFMGMELKVTYDDASVELLREKNGVIEDSQGCRAELNPYSASYYDSAFTQDTSRSYVVFQDTVRLTYPVVSYKPIGELLSGTLKTGAPVTIGNSGVKYYRLKAETTEYQLEYTSGGRAVPGSVYLLPRCEAAYGDKGSLTGLKPGETYYVALWFNENLPVTVTLKANNASQEACKHTGGKATCLAQAVCSKCGKPYGKKAAHSFSSAWTVDKAATYTTEGLRSHHCATPGCTATSGSEKIAKAELTLNVGSSLPMKVKQSATIKVSGLLKGDAVRSWKSSDTKIVKVSKAGKVTAQSKTGKATVTLTLKSGYSKKLTVTVQAGAVACDKITLNKKSVSLKAGKSFTLKPTASPITCVQKAKYSSSDKKVAAVSGKGKVTAKKKGKATITVTIGKKKATCKVTVK